MMDDEVKGWLIKAESDFRVIEHELKLPDDEIVKDAVCFHCQQAVEKYLKAFLIHHKIHL
jgi:HEPN domain-containing protein